MERVRVPRPPQVAHRPAVQVQELSKEERHQLRVIKHHAFQRHQQNAALMHELLRAQPTLPKAPEDDSVDATHADELGLLMDAMRARSEAIGAGNVKMQEETDGLKQTFAQTNNQLHDHMNALAQAKTLEELEKCRQFASAWLATHEPSGIPSDAATSAPAVPRVVKL